MPRARHPNSHTPIPSERRLYFRSSAHLNSGTSIIASVGTHNSQDKPPRLSTLERRVSIHVVSIQGSFDILFWTVTGPLKINGEE